MVRTARPANETVTLADYRTRQGAENHTPATEGDFGAREAASRQAYAEWMPVRLAADGHIHRRAGHLHRRLEDRRQPGDDLAPGRGHAAGLADRTKPDSAVRWVQGWSVGRGSAKIRKESAPS